MRRHRFVIVRRVVFILALLWASSASARDLSDLAWLQGCWRLNDARGETTEVWFTPPAEVMLGYDVTVRSGTAPEWGQMRIEVRSNDFVLFDMPRGRGPIMYQWTELGVRGDATRGRIGFETLDRRYPQRVVYERLGDQLTVTWYDWRGAATPSVFARSACPAAPAR